MRGILGQPEQDHARVRFQPGLDDFGRMRWRLVERQREPTCRIDSRQPLEKGDNMDRQFALMLGKEPLPAHSSQRAEKRRDAG